MWPVLVAAKLFNTGRGGLPLDMNISQPSYSPPLPKNASKAHSNAMMAH